MNDTQFREAVIAAMAQRVTDAEADAVGAQCAQDLAAVYANRIGAIIHEWTKEHQGRTVRHVPPE